MKETQLTVKIKRDIRLERWNVSQCEAELTGVLDETDDLAAAYKDLYDSVDYIVNEMIEKELVNFKEKKIAIKNQPKK